jgi:hypothetical protein
MFFLIKNDRVLGWAASLKEKEQINPVEKTSGPIQNGKK